MLKTKYGKSGTFEIYAIKSCKNVRANNQDSAMLLKMNTEAGSVSLAAVADGLGGMDHGEIASGYIIENLSKWFYKDLVELLKSSSSVKNIKISLYKQIYISHNELKEYGCNNGIKVGTTISVLFCVNRKYVIIHVGDSAIYRKRRNVKLLTRMEKREPSVIDKCVGIGGLRNVYTKTGTVKKNEHILLCTDGFYNCQDVKEFFDSVKNIKSKENADKYLKSYIKKIIGKGERDNITAIYLKF